MKNEHKYTKEQMRKWNIIWNIPTSSVFSLLNSSLFKKTNIGHVTTLQQNWWWTEQRQKNECSKWDERKNRKIKMWTTSKSNKWNAEE